MVQSLTEQWNTLRSCFWSPKTEVRHCSCEVSGVWAWWLLCSDFGLLSNVVFPLCCQYTIFTWKYSTI